MKWMFSINSEYSIPQPRVQRMHFHAQHRWKDTHMDTHMGAHAHTHTPCLIRSLEGCVWYSNEHHLALTLGREELYDAQGAESGWPGHHRQIQAPLPTSLHQVAPTITLPCSSLLGYPRENEKCAPLPTLVLTSPRLVPLVSPHWQALKAAAWQGG